MSDGILVLYFDGPMQSWGHQSRFNRRTTLSFPTRSGITGTLCAALGVDRSDREKLAKLANLKMEVYCLGRCGRWTDYHTVGGGYDHKTQRHLMPRKANEATPATVLTDREYLSDARFGVLLEGDQGLLRHCEEALHNPVWGIWLGRKCCIPASLICRGIFGERAEAIADLTSVSGAKAVRHVKEVRQFDEGTDTLMDIPICFATREFIPRRVSDEPMAE